MVLPHLAQICSCSGSSQTTFLRSSPSVSSSLVRLAFRACAFTGVVFPGSGADASLQTSASLKKSSCWASTYWICSLDCPNIRLRIFTSCSFRDCIFTSCFSNCWFFCSSDRIYAATSGGRFFVSRFMAALLPGGFSVSIIPGKEPAHQQKSPSQGEKFPVENRCISGRIFPENIFLCGNHTSSFGR